VASGSVTEVKSESHGTLQSQRSHQSHQGHFKVSSVAEVASESLRSRRRPRGQYACYLSDDGLDADEGKSHVV